MKNAPLSPELIDRYFDPDTIRLQLFDRIETLPFALTDKGYCFNHLCLIHNYEELSLMLRGLKAKLVDADGNLITTASLSNNHFSEEDFIEEILLVTGADREILIRSPKFRRREYVLTRQLHMMVRHLAFRDTTSVAGEVYKKDHSTVLHGIKTINNLRQVDSVFRKKTDRISFMINNYV